MNVFMWNISFEFHCFTREGTAVSSGAPQSCVSLFTPSEENGFKAPSPLAPQGWGRRQAVMLSLRRKVAERIRTHTESISIEPLSSCARMSQDDPVVPWRENDEVNLTGFHLHRCLLLKLTWIVGAHSDRLCSTSVSRNDRLLLKSASAPPGGAGTPQHEADRNRSGARGGRRGSEIYNEDERKRPT